jgi:cytochrome oxidase Cu insertion factor (SCO1/SenC/PrrC family)
VALATVCLGASLCRADPRTALQQAWQWRDERSNTVSFARWRGTPVVLMMFYRTCEARCSPAIERLRKLEAAFAQRGQHPQFVLVTLDPRNDTPARLAAFKKSRRLPDSWHLLQGPSLQTRALARELEVNVAGDDGHLEHETKVFFYDAGGTLQRAVRGWRFTDAEALGS